MRLVNCSAERVCPGIATVFTLLLWLSPFAQAQPRWKLASDGGITWDVRRGDVHQDHIEMSGRKVSVIAGYGM